MGREKCLNREAKYKIVQQIKQGTTIKHISTNTTRDPSTIARFIDDPLEKTVRKDQAKMKALTRRALSIEGNANNIKEHHFWKCRY